ncbi:hypothetical protein Hanom_Chr07g00624121 [Helianthus anomalus]
MSDSEKKITILKYLVKTQQMMLWLHVLGQWCQQVCVLFVRFIIMNYAVIV